MAGHQGAAIVWVTPRNSTTNAGLGAEEVVPDIPGGPAGEVLRMLDGYAAFLDRPASG